MANEARVMVLTNYFAPTRLGNGLNRLNSELN